MKKSGIHLPHSVGMIGKPSVSPSVLKNDRLRLAEYEKGMKLKAPVLLKPKRVNGEIIWPKGMRWYKKIDYLGSLPLRKKRVSFQESEKEAVKALKF